MKINWSGLLDFARGYVRPFIAYLFSVVFAGLAVYLVIRFGNADLAQIIIIGFIELATAIIAYYFGQRQRPSP